MDQSIINLKNDPHKHVYLTHKKGTEDVVVSLDRAQDRVLRR